MTDETTPQPQSTPNESAATEVHATTPSTEGSERRRSRKRVIWIGSLAAGVLVLGGAGTAWALSENDDDALAGDALDRASEVALAEVGDGSVTDSERRDGGGFELEITRPDGREIDVLLDGDYEVVAVDRGDDGRDGDAADADQHEGDATDTTDDATGSTTLEPLTDDEIARAADAALAETGGGEVVDVDRSDDADHAFEVEVRLADGTEVEVELDESFAVVPSGR
ncbi:YpeB-like protein with putative protease inhibitory function [Diaminobutyricimonas aerilata]|uniref:YpeB-like protein with putative protease inhibitory function n=1 Tax=Diaminobutyricimonas aerilata TaxID=1162967 RepID=A0A2M9CLC8_9MICO|nr:PepSY domain-containing protein [Diaminobutyricimonas aerilata]PJJ72690.1 YpeB-like protein with putative protease inhibitory function [Diaminobutyricimonas aerilata]